MADAVKAVRAAGVPRYTGFLSGRQRQLAVAALNREGWAEYAFFGGYQGAEREMLCVFEDNGDVDWPVAVLGITRTGAGEPLNHRDVLGALLGLGIRRDCVGDILPTETGAVALVQSTVAGAVEEQLTGVGRAAVKVARLAEMPADTVPDTGRQQTASVASLRLDAALAAMLNLSRDKAAALVQAERVQVNHRLVRQGHQALEEGDVLSVRGVGRLRLDTVGGQSKKGRTFITYTVF